MTHAGLNPAFSPAHAFLGEGGILHSEIKAAQGELTNFTTSNYKTHQTNYYNQEWYYMLIVESFLLL